ncbi:hypothetical protein PQH03_28200 [Ralstonia insidiosa]|jgi:hypothetical protein|uniref:Uncharacterized protein n=1 Tax=Ralstonia insidiosa TaxID=190721 RepID=A0A192A7D1_9RALS|nr:MULTISPECIES: hypothetical protein [Ralstonia]KMW44889.1 hypothetical protein AC240_23325 [Ralstonia sp. MD27]ANJ76248.1 hypothetical protein A9Y76_26940 [Ralstonia insidiosa]MBA9869565.1 hypothetical protein [Ralstonia insidiosa]MBA9913726.1 hypothetical protein [Ralstonia insidiosa]MBA9952561.1 hypothetical protein [Ralstonia insidiosa]
MKKLLAVALMMVVVVAKANVNANAGDTGRYRALPSDKTVAGLVTRLGAQDGLVVKWAAGYDVEVDSAEAFTNEANLSSASSLVEAVQRIVKLLATKPVAGELVPKETPLVACVYAEGKGYIVVRPVGESCEGPRQRP